MSKKIFNFLIPILAILLFFCCTFSNVIIASADSTAPISNGIYYLENKETKTYMQVDNNDSSNNYSTSGAIMELWSLASNEMHCQWRFTYLNNGYYKITSVKSGLSLSVAEGKENTDGESLIQKAYSGAYRQQWNIETLSDGYVLRARSSDDYRPSHDWCMSAGTQFLWITDGLNVEQRARSDDDEYKDVWYIVNKLPTSGSELEYTPNAWNNSTVIKTANCYSYALNAFINPTTGIREFMQPGQSAGYTLTSDKITASYVKYLVKQDSITLGFKFNAVDKNTKCSTGTYKVALVIADKRDYHWYRQDPDGFWSHKPGQTAVKRTDNSGNLIVDPEFANRGSYTTFVGYFQVTPITTTTVSTSAINDNLAQKTIAFAEAKSSLPEATLANSIVQGMNYIEVTDLIGLPQRQVTYGIVVVEYDLNDGTVLQVEYLDHLDGGYCVEKIQIITI